MPSRPSRTSIDSSRSMPSRSARMSRVACAWSADSSPMAPCCRCCCLDACCLWSLLPRVKRCLGCGRKGARRAAVVRCPPGGGVSSDAPLQ